MPQELPGFYYDKDKNRYFPVKGSIPGSRKRKPSPSPPPYKSTIPATSKAVRKTRSTQLLLQGREIHGNTISSRTPKLNFQFEYHKTHASNPLIFKYHATENMSDHALEHLTVDVSTSEGTTTADILLAGGLHGTFCLFEVGERRPEFRHWVNLKPHHVWPAHVNPLEKPADLQRNVYGTLGFSSDVTCIKTLPNHPVSAADASYNHFLITTLGCETTRGSLYHLRFREPIDSSRVPLQWQNIDEVTSFNRTIWTADCDHDGVRAVIGTNQGAIMVDVETGVRTSVCRGESDVLSLQIDHSGNFVLCGLRNGAILTLDARQKPEDYSARLARHRIFYPPPKPSDKRIGSSTKRWFEIKGKLYPDCTTFMHSSISCLSSLKLYDQYFCASSMDGSIKLYDHRLIQRGAIQSYDGNVNSHSRIRFGIDPTERILISGGEDGNLRQWSIKTGELLFESKVMNSAPSIVCWPRNEGLEGVGERCFGAWLGSQEGLFYVKWPWNHA